jgi:hypothetical protein
VSEQGNKKVSEGLSERVGESGKQQVSESVSG